MPESTRTRVLGSNKEMFARGNVIMVAKVEDGSILPKRFALMSSQFGKFVARLYSAADDIRSQKRNMRVFIDASKEHEKKGWAELITTNKEDDDFDFMVHFRLYRYSDEEKDYTPTTRGIGLTMGEYGEFVSHLEETILKTVSVDNFLEMELIKDCVDTLFFSISPRGGPHAAYANFATKEKNGDFKSLYAAAAKKIEFGNLRYEEFIKHYRRIIKDAAAARTLQTLDAEISEEMSSQEMFDFN